MAVVIEDHDAIYLALTLFGAGRYRLRGQANPCPRLPKKGPMSTKVLVFESDAAFAGELRNELGKLGCNTNVVDDGNVGLQQAASDRPDLILLSIELPRMNGFSVCNKLKKDPALKDVPLIIMSSESSDETFEQHRKLRTRAEDYVHKPIAFGDLLARIQPFAAFLAQAPAAAAPPAEADDADHPTGHPPAQATDGM